MANKYGIGVDLGGTKILAAVVELATGQVVASAKKKTVGNKEKDLANRISATVEEALALANLPPELRPATMGIGAAGQVDREQGMLIFAPNLGAPSNYPIASLLSEKLQIPVKLGNDVEVATIGEHNFGSGVNHSTYICVFVGTGIGGGIVKDGKLYQGTTGTAGEIGHIVISAGGRHCGCGGRGHLEAYSSRTAITRTLLGELKRGRPSILRELMAEDGLADPTTASSVAIQSKTISHAVAANDALVNEVLAEAATYLGLGLASVINFYNPERIILGGGLIEAVDPFFQQVADKAKFEALPVSAKSVDIVRTKLGDFSGVVGAALIGQR